MKPGEEVIEKTIDPAAVDALFNMTGAEVSDISSTNHNPFVKTPDAAEKALQNLSIINSSPEEKADDKSSKTVPTAEEIEAALKLDNQEEEVVEPVSKQKNSIDIAVIKTLLKDGILLPADEEEGKEKPLEEYTQKELAELIKGNIEHKVKEAQDKALSDFFDSMPEAIQELGAYVLNGGTDLKPVLRAMLASQEVKELDPKNEADQEKIVRQWNLSTGMTAEEADEEVASLKDMPGALEKKANQYKPKLDAKHQADIEKFNKDQKALKDKNDAAVLKYHENVVGTLQKGELNGLKITPTTQQMLYEGIAQFKYPSVRHKAPITEVEALLEQNIFRKPNLSLVAKVAWLLKDEAGFEEAVKKAAGKEIVKEAVIKLKTTSGEKNSAQTMETTVAPKKQVIQKRANLFERLKI